MSYLIVSICVREAKQGAENQPKVSLIKPEEKYALITDIVLVALLATGAILITLANHGLNLGPINSIGMKTVYIIVGCAGGIVIFDLTNFIVRRLQHLAHLEKMKHPQPNISTSSSKEEPTETQPSSETSKKNFKKIEIEEEEEKAKTQVLETLHAQQDAARQIEEEIQQVRGGQEVVAQTEKLAELQTSIDAQKKSYEELQKRSRIKNKVMPLADIVKGGGEGELAEKLAIHWLKDAATRIFHDPLRSFLELVVNALDASVPPEQGVGKFGMGFMSILGFLDHPETEGCTLQIQTTAMQGYETLSLTIDLFKEQQSYQVIFKDVEKRQETGTTITILPKKGAFSDQTLNSLSHYCSALQFYQHGKIEISSEGKKWAIGEGSKTLAWVTLEKGYLIVQDKGCGISEEVAYKQLFIPSTSTKSAHKEALQEIRLPEFKVYGGKKDSRSYFIITINGVVVICIPFKSATQEDLLLRLPPFTRLTLARDAVENRPETIHYLKRVIDETVRVSVASEEGALLLLAHYKGLKAWEEMAPSIAEPQLSVYLHLSVQKLFQEGNYIPYPLEQAQSLHSLLPPQNTKLIPFPKELLFDNFAPFETLLEEHYRNQKRDDLIAGKSVLFIDSDKVTSLGLRNWVFAPKTLLEANPSKKTLRISLVTRFADEGKELECAPKKKISLLPPSMARMNGPKGFLFFSGRDTLPRLLTWEYDKYHLNYFHILSKKYKTDLSRRSQENTQPFIPLVQLRKIFEKAEDRPFQEMWEKHRDSLLKALINNKVDLIFQDKIDICFDIGYSLESQTEKLKTLEKLKSCIVYYGSIAHEITFFSIKEPEETLKQFLQDSEGLRDNKWGACDLSNSLRQGKIDPHLNPLTPAEGCKLLFAWLFAQMGVLDEGVKIFTDEKMIWPPQEITLEYLENCFDLFFNNRIETSKKVIAARSLSSFQEQQGVWKIVEEFRAYHPFGPSAIPHILPLLLLKEKMAHEELPVQLHRKFELFVQQLLAHYHHFLEIKIGDVDTVYGSDHSTVSVIETREFHACSVDEMVHLLTSLKDKPILFEKCLDLYVQEMGERMNTKKRNRELANRKSLYIENITFNNGIALLSMAKSLDVDPFLIETILKHVNNPFELYMMGLVLVGKYHKTYFVNPADKKAAALILTEAITIYLRKTKPYQYIKTYNVDYSEFSCPRHTFERHFGELLWPFYNYFYDVGESAQRSGKAFTTQKQAIAEPIESKLKDAGSFTSKQVLHAGRHKSDELLTALQKGLDQALEMIGRQPQESDLQMVYQAIEHGSPRPWMAATLIEAFQNAVDAILAFLRKNPDAPKEKTSVGFDVRLVGEQKSKLLLEVSDPIGMQNLKTLLYDFLIPNYSEKGEESVGEMGNGSYQMYREAELVIVKTRTLDDPSTVYFLKIDPIRHPETHEVIDLRHTCVDITAIEPQFVGTTLNVIMRGNHTSQTAVIFEAMVARNFIKETFTLANPPLGEKHTLQCTLQFPKDKLPLKGINRDLAFKTNSSDFCCYEMVQKQDLGYVLTAGYPFKPLEIFLVEEGLFPPELAAEVARGWCLNLPKGLYAPVQSRDRVYMTQENKEKLKVMLLEWLYFRSCCQESNGPQTRYYPHFESSCPEFDQVYPTARKWVMHPEQEVLKKGDPVSLEAFFVYYKPFFLQKSFLQYIEEGYETLVNPLLKKRRALLLSFKGLTPENRTALYTERVETFESECRKIEKQWEVGLRVPTDSDEKFPDYKEYKEKFLKNVLIPWFSKKTSFFCGTIPSLEDLTAHNEKIQTQKEIENHKIQHDSIGIDKAQFDQVKQCARDVLTPYCQWYAALNGMEKKPSISFSYLLEPKTAYYRADKHTIYLNLARLTLSSIVEMGQQVASETPLKDNAMVSISYCSSGILNHELEHARRGQSCGRNTHAKMEIEGREFDFEACAAFFAKKAHTHNVGLFEKWAKELKSMIFPSSDIIAKLIEIEKTCPQMICKFVTPK